MNLDQPPEDPAPLALERFRDAKLRFWATGNLPRRSEERQSAADTVLRTAFDILAAANRQGAISEALAVRLGPTGRNKGELALDAGSEVLKHFAQVLAVHTDEESKHLHNAVLLLSLTLFEVLTGRTPSSDIIAAKDRGQGRPPAAIVTLRAQRLFVLAIHFISGREDRSLESAFGWAGAWVAFETFRTWQKTHASVGERKIAKSAGRKTRQNAVLNEDEGRLVAEIGKHVRGAEDLAYLARLASGDLPPLGTWGEAQNEGE